MRIIFCLLSFVFYSATVAAETLEFNMLNKHGDPVTAQSYPDKYLLLTVGYTTCPDICPTTLLTLKSILQKLGDNAKQVTPVFISIDPNRDTHQKLNQYVGFFDNAIEALVGNSQQTAAIASNIGASYGYQIDGLPASEPLPKRYEVFHSSYFYLYGPDQQLIDVFGYGMNGSRMAEEIIQYLPSVEANHG
ncbi:SCO family protein [Shewanella sp. 3_MG-2023]|uniref:SCO family protein n=1 Tax=Shewanella sp. 3_MG-2023 TaxID=3062635 RepID=UPI0026E2036F|nr:SCO family protein [Shewanella sp. 3_MG-2023]MDO6776961.1 SCO family protein [Shewanella sp. 3_MG-2023]